MNFVNPSFLWALLAVFIPLLIHLFNFRKFKTVYFTNVRFLKEVKQETQRKSKLKHWLVLLSRMLAVIFLVGAFAQPYIHENNAGLLTGDEAVSVFIDNSFSMDAVNKSGALLDEAKKHATQIVSQYKPTDLFQLLTNDFEGKHQRLVNREEFLEWLYEVKISPSTKTISEIIARQNEALKNSGRENRQSFIISDFQKSISDFENIKNDTSVRVNLIPVIAQNHGNVFIDSLWFESPVRQLNHSEILNVRMENASEKKIENNPIKLYINGRQKTPASFTIDPNGKVTVKLSFASKATGIQQGRVEINDYPVTYDDKFYFSFDVTKSIAVMYITPEKKRQLLVSSNYDYIKSLFGKDSLFTLTASTENQLDYASLQNNKLVILNGLVAISSGLAQELNRFIRNGGSIVVFPSEASELESYKEFLTSVHANYFNHIDTTSTKVDRMNYEHRIYGDVFVKKQEGIDLPSATRHFKITASVRSNEEWLMKMRNGDAFLTQHAFGKGKIYLSAVPLNTEWSNFAEHALLVPTLLKIAAFSQPSNKLFCTVGKDEAIETSNTPTGGEHVFHIKAESNNAASSGGFDIIPEYRRVESETDIFVHNQITNAGNYFLYSGGEQVAGLSFNYNRKESDLNCYSTDEIVKQYESAGLTNFFLINTRNKEITEALAGISGGKKLWKWCVILVLLFLAAEVALLRFWK